MILRLTPESQMVRTSSPDYDATRTARFWSKVNKAEGCWLWTGCLNGKGYGGFCAGARMVKAHRFAYELLVGPIPDGLTIDHLCRVRHCVNPDHLEAVTNRENILRGVGITAQCARKTHCVNGHEFTPENTYRNNRGFRVCRACVRRIQRVRYRRRAAGLLKPANSGENE